MRTYFISLLVLILLASCAKPPIRRTKITPDHPTEISDPQIKAIVNEFMDLSKRNNIKFKNNVSIGFTKINDGNVIGTCSYRMTFREIDIDIEYWKTATWISKTALVYHELAHCYCNRDHDFGDGTLYPDDSLAYLFQSWFKKSTFNLYRPEGYFEDNCPMSIMYPKIIDDYCFRVHYNEYVEEMFNRCDAY